MHTFYPVWRRGSATVGSCVGSVGSLPRLLFRGDRSAHNIKLRCLAELCFEVCALLVFISTVNGGSRFSIVLFVHCLSSVEFTGSLVIIAFVIRSSPAWLWWSTMLPMAFAQLVKLVCIHTWGQHLVRSSEVWIPAVCCMRYVTFVCSVS